MEPGYPLLARVSKFVLSLLGQSSDIASGDLGSAVQEVLKDKTTIKNFIEAAKKDYKKVKEETDNKKNK